MIIGCKLPNGFTLTTGVPGDDYEYFNIPGGTPKKPGTASVPDAVWNRWLKTNPKFRYVVDGSLFVVK